MVSTGGVDSDNGGCPAERVTCTLDMVSNLSRKVKLGGMAEELQERRKLISYCLLKMACGGCFGQSKRASGSLSHGGFFGFMRGS